MTYLNSMRLSGEWYRDVLIWCFLFSPLVTTSTHRQRKKVPFLSYLMLICTLRKAAREYLILAWPPTPPSHMWKGEGEIKLTIPPSEAKTPRWSVSAYITKKKGTKNQNTSYTTKHTTVLGSQKKKITPY